MATIEDWPIGPASAGLIFSDKEERRHMKGDVTAPATLATPSEPGVMTFHRVLMERVVRGEYQRDKVEVAKL